MIDQTQRSSAAEAPKAGTACFEMTTHHRASAINHPSGTITGPK
jgi:hypothetical protein